MKKILMCSFAIGSLLFTGCGNDEKETSMKKLYQVKSEIEKPFEFSLGMTVNKLFFHFKANEVNFDFLNKEFKFDNEYMVLKEITSNNLYFTPLNKGNDLIIFSKNEKLINYDERIFDGIKNVKIYSEGMYKVSNNATVTNFMLINDLVLNDKKYVSRKQLKELADEVRKAFAYLHGRSLTDGKMVFKHPRWAINGDCIIIDAKGYFLPKSEMCKDENSYLIGKTISNGTSQNFKDTAYIFRTLKYFD
jgi:hypothetical protein